MSELDELSYSSADEVGGAGASQSKRKPRKLVEKWTRDEIKLLIRTVQLHPDVWNVNLVSYGNKYKKQSALESIANIVGKSPSEVCLKWQNLRSHFNAELRKCRQRKSIYDMVVYPKWEFFDLMSFSDFTNFTSGNESAGTSNLQMVNFWDCAGMQNCFFF